MILPLSPGGNTVRLWDSLAGGKLLMELTNHHKTVMSLAFADNCRRLLTAGLDRWVYLLLILINIISFFKVLQIFILSKMNLKSYCDVFSYF